MCFIFTFIFTTLTFLRFFFKPNPISLSLKSSAHLHKCVPRTNFPRLCVLSDEHPPPSKGASWCPQDTRCRDLLQSTPVTSKPFLRPLSPPSRFIYGENGNFVREKRDHHAFSCASECVLLFCLQTRTQPLSRCCSMGAPRGQGHRSSNFCQANSVSQRKMCYRGGGFRKTSHIPSSPL